MVSEYRVVKGRDRGRSQEVRAVRNRRRWRTWLLPTTMVLSEPGQEQLYYAAHGRYMVLTALGSSPVQGDTMAPLGLGLTLFMGSEVSWSYGWQRRRTAPISSFIFYVVARVKKICPHPLTPAAGGRANFRDMRRAVLVLHYVYQLGEQTLHHTWTKQQSWPWWCECRWARTWCKLLLLCLSMFLYI